MLLRNRILALFGGVTVLVAVAVSVPAVLILQEREERLQQLRAASQVAFWTDAMEQVAHPLAALARELETDPQLSASLSHTTSGALRERLGELHRERLAMRGVVRAEVIDPAGDLLAAAPSAIGIEPLAQSGAGTETVALAQAREGTPLLLAATVRTSSGFALTLAAEALPLMPALGAALGAPIFVLDRHGNLLGTSDLARWRPLREALRAAGGRSAALAAQATLVEEGRRFRVTATPLMGGSGTFLGDLLTLRDDSAESRQREMVVLLAGALLAGSILIIAVLLYRTIRRTLDPLTEVAEALKAVAGGDIYASAAVAARRDEVGEIAFALEEVRDSGLSLDRLQTRERLADLRERAVIRAEVMRLAEVLMEPARGEVQAMLAEAERQAGGDAAVARGGTLARAFSHMSDLVIGQHGRLVELLAERTRDLEIVRQALAERDQLVRMREELEVARKLQLSSLPTDFPERPEFQLFASTLPAKEVGGDFYDFVIIGQGTLAICIGDAAGKGVPAAMFVAMARSLIRAALMRGASPAEALAQANDVLSVDNPSVMFATAFVALLDIATGRLRFASAGHNPPRLRRADGREAMLHGAAGVALGVMEGMDFDDLEDRLTPGDTLLCYTDGVTEAEGPGDSQFGDDRLAALMRAETLPGARDLVQAVQEDVDRFAAGEPQADDITMLCLVWTGAEAARAEEGMVAAAG